MDRTSVLTLIGVEYSQDQIGQSVPTEIPRKVFCAVSSIGYNEWNAAGQQGLKPQLKVTMFAPEYRQEQTAELHGKRYSIYRTYRTKGEQIELYLEEKAGI